MVDYVVSCKAFALKIILYVVVLIMWFLYGLPETDLFLFLLGMSVHNFYDFVFGQFRL